MQALIQELLASVALGAQEHAAPGGSGAGAIEHGAGYTLLVPLFTILATILCGICAAFRVKSKLPAWISVGLLGASFVVVLYTYLNLGAEGQRIAYGFRWIDVRWGDGPGQALIADFAFHIDALTLLWMLFVTGLGTLIGLYASEYMAHDVGVGYCRFFAAFNLFVFSMTCLVMADNLLLLYLGWEGVGLCSYLLIGYFYKKPSAVAAAKKAFIMNRIGDLGLALGVMLIFVQFGTLRYEDLFANEELKRCLALAGEGRWGEIPAAVQAIALLLMIGAFGKSAQLPLYVWLPDAMEGPTPVSALIHAATMVTAGVFMIARMYPVFLVSEYALPIVAWTGALTALLAATIGMAQFDIKRIMAYSTISQLGYMFAGLGVLTSVGACFHVFTHAFFKATLFLCCGAVMHGFAGQLDLRKVSGLWSLPGWRITVVAMAIGCLNLAGFPSSAGYFSKDMILAEAFTTPGFGLLGWVLLITAGLTAYYTFRVFFRVFVGPVDYTPGDEGHGHEDEGTGHRAQGTGHDDHGHAVGHGRVHAAGFHPHPPKWAINGVLGTLAVLSILAAGVYLVKGEHGWVGDMVHHSSAAYESPYGHHDAGHSEQGTGHSEAGTFLGFDPHQAMYFVSAFVGLFGILVAARLHGPRGAASLGLGSRTEAATARADELLPVFGPVARWARNKWYVDELYDFLFVRPLWVIAHILHLIDKLLVDGIVNGFGWLPRVIGNTLRPSQSGALHGYALGMAGGIAVLLLIVVLVTA